MVPLVIAFTPNYFIPAITCLKSLVDSSKDKDELFEIICLVETPLSENHIHLLNITFSNRVLFRFIYLSDKLTNIKVNKRFSTASLYRMLLPDLLPEYKTIIYHDCDIIIRQDLAKLYKTINLKDVYLGAVFEATLPNQYHILESVGCNPGEYFNSGFLIMNLDNMRKDNISEKLINEASSFYSDFLDQDVLNKICYGHCLKLHPKYNFNRTMILPQFKNIFLNYYSEKEYDEGIKFGNIHYTGGKPWNEYTVMFKEWWDVFYSLPIEVQRLQKIPIKLKMLYLLEKCIISRFLLKIFKYFKRIIK